jgi:hypothetical protein
MREAFERKINALTALNSSKNIYFCKQGTDTGITP